MALAVALAAVLTWPLTRSTTTDEQPAGGRSSTIAVDPDDGSVWLTSPDDDQVVVMDHDLSVRARTTVAGDPAQLTIAPKGVLVTAAGDPHLRLLDRPTGAVTGELELPCGSSRSVVVVEPDHRTSLAAVSCPAERRVVLVDVDAWRVAAFLAVDGRPTALVATDDRLVVATDDGDLLAFANDGLRAALAGTERNHPSRPRAVRLRPTQTRVWADGGRSVSQLRALDVTSSGEVVGAYQLVDARHVPSALELTGDTYGSLHDGRARIEPAIAGSCGARFADFAEPGGRVSGPAAIATTPDRPELVWVVGQYTGTVALVRCGGEPADRSTIVGTWTVGAGARGIAVADDGDVAYVDVGFDHVVVRLDRDDAEAASETDPRHRELLTPSDRITRQVATSLSPAAEAGRRAFHDATDPHLTPFGIVTCASCHPDGGDDGLAWRLETDRIAAKVRRTPPLWGLDGSTKPLHWDGAFGGLDELLDLTVTELLGGDGLGVDHEAMAAYLASLRPPPAAATELDGGGRAGAVERGRQLFASTGVGCVDCHRGSAGTDGDRHPPLTSSTDPLVGLPEVITPTLWGVRDRQALGHDGAVASLADLLGPVGHGGADQLTEEERADLEAYLRTR